MEKLLKKIFLRLQKNINDFQVYEDLYYASMNSIENDIKLAVLYLKKLSSAIGSLMPHLHEESDVKKFFELHKKIHC